MKLNRAIKVRLYPNKEQSKFLDITIGCCRFIYNKMLEERIQIYRELKEDKESLYSYKYKTEKQYKQLYTFLKKADSNALQQSRIHLHSAYSKFFKGLSNFPRFKSRKKSRKSYTTCQTNNNCKIDFEAKKLKLPKLNSWIKYNDNRAFNEQIKSVTISKTKSGKYFASILIEYEKDIESKQVIEDKRIVGFDMSASKFLITKELELINPRFYRNTELKLKKLHREVSRKKKGSNNKNKARIKLSTLYEKIANRKNDWIHKITTLLSNHFDCVILEDLNIKGMQKFNSGLSKSVSLDFSWNQFISILKYKMEQSGKYLILIDRFFPSSKLCSECGYKNDDLELSDREWICPDCHTYHDRDVNASVNIRNEGIRILKEDNITIISSNDTAVGTTVDAFGENVRLMLGQQFSMNYESIAL